MTDDDYEPIEEAHPVGFGLVEAPSVDRRGLDEISVHASPRISATKLAEYVIADPSRQKSIIRDAKFPRKVVIIPYKRTRDFIKRAFCEDSLHIDKLVRRAEEIEGQDESEDMSEWQRNDRANSATALRKIATIAPELLWKKGRIVLVQPGGLEFAGVKVSIRPEVTFAFDHRNIRKTGAIILNTAKGEEKSLARSNGTHCVGDYLTSLLFQMLLLRAGRIGAPVNTQCYAVDVFREKVYTAPASYRRLNKNIEAACETIALRWPEIRVEN